MDWACLDHLNTGLTLGRLGLRAETYQMFGIQTHAHAHTVEIPQKEREVIKLCPLLQSRQILSV